MTQESTSSLVAEEPILEPEIEITDAHFHFGGTSVAGKTSRPGGPSHEYDLDMLLQDTGSGHKVTSTVFVEASGWTVTQPTDAIPDDPSLPCCPPLGALDETQRAATFARESESRGGAVVRAIVGFVDLRHGSEAGDALDAMQEASGGRLVGIRQSSAWDASPDIPTARSHPGEGLLTQSYFHTGFAQLARRDMSFDAWLYHPQLGDVAALADAFPETRIVVCHLGGPLGMGPYKTKRNEVLSLWKKQMTELQKRPNIFVKLGGIGTRLLADPEDVTGEPGVEPTSMQLAEYWGSEVRWCVETFGASRCLFESNFPADGRMCSYSVLWNAFKRMVADASPAEKRDLFAGTANRVYGLADRSAALRS